MSPINSHISGTGVEKRVYYTSDSPAWDQGRWILFVVLAVGLLLLLLYTRMLNRKRASIGQAPIRGTAWISPPTYRQSQRQHNRGTGDVTDDFVPEYTERANDQDLGYYDQSGEFHLNSKVEYQSPPPLSRRGSDSTASLERPQAAVTRIPTDEMEIDFRRYRPTTAPPGVSNTATAPVPATSTATASSSTDTTTTGDADIELHNISSPDKAKLAKL